MTLEAIRDLRCPACGFYAVIREPTRDFCLLCSWEHEHERRVRTLALDRLFDDEPDAKASDAA
jgi:hypothetical protein